MINHTSFRARDYADTLNVLKPFVKLTGITRLADITYLDYVNIPVCTAIRPRAKSLTTSQGKGITKEAAQCSALMESIEVYFAEELKPELFNVSEHDLIKSGKSFIPINHLAKSVRFTNQKLPINWISAKLLFSNKSVLVPFAEYSLNSYLPEVLIYSPDSTGLAGGNTYNEALLHGILEVIERQDVHCENHIHYFESQLINKISSCLNLSITYKENNYRIPSFEVLIKSKKTFENQILFKGNGCHIDKTIALNRAITEAIQSRLTTIAGSRDDLINTKYYSGFSEFPNITNKKNFTEVLDYSAKTIEEAISILFRKIQANNEDILVYTYYDKEICIVKVKLISMDLLNQCMTQ
ncbi:hypothetical protein Lbir_1954 [Legionella birminghamensis]|uniref:Uncharacterized domain n=1 Tax=Legionella birminghamensis TaxID=28083 RepID=A0A378JQV5_9GAMM|nr:YcaO-like family protein [Legionella birminghamensis]KTC69814.1 hypothetical protein Lbir_1954 [Legionella birminghamensis]STX60914.1 uncharacterized domain [Legionella birminghamensis]